MNDANYLRLAMHIFSSFRQVHRRATDVILKLYGLEPDFAINRLKNRDFMGWYRFKRYTKVLEKELEFMDYNGRSWKNDKPRLKELLHKL